MSRLTGHRLRDFARLRPQAEALVSQKARAAGLGDPKLADIYEFFQEQGILGPEESGRVMAAELALEKKFLHPRPAGLELFERAKAAGKRVFLISDMYLDREVLAGILNGLGLNGYERLYVSCEDGGAKRDGRLFEIFLNREHLAASELLHIGDHADGDVKAPRSLGIHTFHLPKSAHLAARNPRFARFLRDRWRSESLFDRAACGLIAARMFSAPGQAADRRKSLSAGRAYDLGYLVLGSFAAGFAVWLAQRARADGVNRLFFLSRDGELLKKAFDLVAPAICPGIESRYLYAARRVANLASITGRADIIQVLHTALDRAGGRLEAFLLEKFDLRLSEIAPEIFARHALSPGYRVRPRAIGSLGPFFLELAPQILEKARRMREAYSAYLEQEGFCRAGPKTAVVDIGFACSLQEGLAKISGNRALGGYYVATYSEAERMALAGQAVAAFAGNFLNRKKSAACEPEDFFVFLEILSLNGQPSLNDFVLDAQGRGQAVFREGRPGDAAPRVMPEIHRGAIDFVKDLVFYFGDFWPAGPVSAEAALGLCLELFRRPGPGDAAVFEGVIFENSYNLEEARYVVPPGRNPALKKNAAWRPPGARARGNGPGPLVLAMESFLVRALAPYAKAAKYGRSRERFFAEARSAWLRQWGRFTGLEI
ncbi:MAG: hypothetical protein LBP33_08010 [Candidatus Adiutrix sp.]|nr:hypothetical protein [Candidatus Adiutrix sp.]